IRVRHERVLPQAAANCGLVDDGWALLDQELQQVERFGRDVDVLTGPRETTTLRIELNLPTLHFHGVSVPRRRQPFASISAAHSAETAGTTKTRSRNHESTKKHASSWPSWFRQELASARTARRSTLPVPSVGIDSMKRISSRFGIHSRGSDDSPSRSQIICGVRSGSV